MSAKTWVLSILALPMLYVLTFPPLEMVTGIRGKRLMDPEYTRAESLRTYGRAWDGLVARPWLRPALQAYSEWWWKVINPLKPVPPGGFRRYPGSRRIVVDTWIE